MENQESIDQFIEIEVDDSVVVSLVELKTKDGTILCAPVTENALKAHCSEAEIEELKITSSIKQRNKELSAGRGKRVEALSYLAVKADQDKQLGDMYSELLSTNAMQTIINRWKDTGNTAIAIQGMSKISGSAKKALDVEVGGKGRTIRAYLYYTMAEATNDLALLA